MPAPWCEIVRDRGASACTPLVELLAAVGFGSAHGCLLLESGDRLLPKLDEAPLGLRRLLALLPCGLLQRRAALPVALLLQPRPFRADGAAALLPEVLDALACDEQPTVELGERLGALLQRIDGPLVLEGRPRRDVVQVAAAVSSRRQQPSRYAARKAKGRAARWRR